VNERSREKAVVRNCSLIVSALVATNFLVACAESPSDAVDELRQAIRTSNPLVIERRVALERLAESYESELLGALRARSSSAELDPALQAAIDRFGRATTDAVRDGTLGAEVAKLFLPAEPELLEVVEGWTVTVDSIGSPVVDGSSSLIPIHFSHPATSEPQTLDLRFESGEEGAWTLVAFSGAQPFLVSVLDAIPVAARDPNSRSLARDVMISDLKNLASQQEIYYSDHYRYSKDFVALTFVTSRQVQVEIVTATGNGWAARTTHSDFPGIGCSLYYGQVKPVPTVGGATPRSPGEIRCDS